MLMVKHSVTACHLDMNYRYYNGCIATIKHTPTDVYYCFEIETCLFL